MSNKLIHISSQGELSFEMALKRNVNKNKNNLKISFLLFQFDNSLTSHNSLKTITTKKNTKINQLQSTRSTQKLPQLENNNKTLLELYSGVGSIGIFLSDKVKEIYSIEIVESAVTSSKENAKLNNVTNIINIQGDATKETLKLARQGKYFDYIVVDPPRKGLELEGIEIILNLKPKKIGYVSCNPATLARDLKLLENHYEIKKVDIVDLFPWTSHTETISVLKLK